MEPATVLVAVAVAAVVGSFVAPSRIARDLDRLAPGGAKARSKHWSPVAAELLERAGVEWSARQVVAVKSLVAALGAAIGVALPLGPIAIPALAYLGFVLPTTLLEQRASRRLRQGEQASASMMEWLEALVAAGRPPESALQAIAARSTGASLLEEALNRSATSYALGAPLFRALAVEARARRLDAVAALAEALERSRDLGRGSLLVIRDARDELRAVERTRSIDAASSVEAKLMLVLVLCYLPALMLAVVVPLFLSLLEGLSL